MTYKHRIGGVFLPLSNPRKNIALYFTIPCSSRVIQVNNVDQGVGCTINGKATLLES